MKKPALVVIAAGMGSRYGGLKQLAPIDEYGRLLIDYSLYDAMLCGFETAVFVIMPETEAEFRETIGNRASRFMDVIYAHQHLADVPLGFCIPRGRKKPWGTAHAVMSARKAVDTSFAVINADDYYGRSPIKTIFNFLTEPRKSDEHAMIGYTIENTVPERGRVSRAICEVNKGSCLTGITERKNVERAGDRAVFIDENGKRCFAESGAIVSMNLWGFSASIMDELEKEFREFLNGEYKADPINSEYCLPVVVNKLINERRASVSVLLTDEKWYGMTYPDDLSSVTAAIRQMKAEGKYPQDIWERH